MGNTTSCCVSSSPKLRRNAHSRLESYRPDTDLSREDTGCNLQHISDRENIDGERRRPRPWPIPAFLSGLGSLAAPLPRAGLARNGGNFARQGRGGPVGSGRECGKRVLRCVYMRVHPGDDMGGPRHCAFGMFALSKRKGIVTVFVLFCFCLPDWSWPSFPHTTLLYPFSH